jgi:hypothetical protein
MLSSLAVSNEPRNRSGDAQHIADILPLVLAKYLTPETQRVLRVDRRPTHNAFPLHLDLSTGSPFSVGGGPFSYSSVQG